MPIKKTTATKAESSIKKTPTKEKTSVKKNPSPKSSKKPEEEKVITTKEPLKEKEKQALKSEELLGQWGFLSWIFGPKDAPKEEIEPEIEEEVIPMIKKNEEPEITEPKKIYNAEVIKAAEKIPTPPTKPRYSYNPEDHKPSSTTTPRTSFQQGKVPTNYQKPVFSSQKPASEKKVFWPKQGDSSTQGTQFRSFVNSNNANRWNSRWGQSSYQQKRPTQPVQQFFKKEREATTSSTLVKKEEILIGASINVKEFSEKMGVPVPEIIKTMLANKIIGGINTSIDFDTASLIALEFGVKTRKETEAVSLDDRMTGNLQTILDLDKESEHLEPRAPIVTIMGHVDHGKTTLLDHLRKTTIAGGEAWGITQSIGASTVIHDGKKITFIDTPGHELFTALRARGAKLTNIVIIVIAADDGIKKQTIEAINHAKEANVPMIVAITKIDKPGATNFDLIKNQLAEQGITPEEWWGDTPIVKVSSKTGQGIDELLETISLKAESLDLQYNPQRAVIGVVLESHKEAKHGITTSMIVLSGNLKIWDIIVIHNIYGKVKRMLDRTGKEIKQAVGWDPVMILGLQEVPEPGRIIEGVANEKQAQEKIYQVQDQEHRNQVSGGAQSVLSKIAQGEITQLKLLIKSDSSGSLEAVKHAIGKIVPPENMDIKVIHTDVGNFSESDLSLAQASGGVMVGFNLPLNANFKKKAEQMKIELKNFDIIYELIEYIEAVLKGMIKIELKEVVIGKLEILGIFYKKEKDMIIGGKILEGEARNGASFRVLRGEEIFTTGKITSLQKGQDNVSKITEGHECGMKVKVSKKIEMGDFLEFYVME